MISRKNPGIQTVIIKDGKIILSEAYGVANIEHNVAVNHQTVFSINSATKSFTAVAIMQLMEDGKIDIFKPLGQYLDSLPQEWANIKIISLLNHTSGIPDFLDTKLGGYVMGLKFGEAWLKIKEMPMEFKEGESRKPTKKVFEMKTGENEKFIESITEIIVEIIKSNPKTV